MRHTFRYLVEEAPQAGAAIRLSETDSHHLVRVVRRREGDELELVDRGGRLWAARLEDAGRRATVRVLEGPREAPSVASLTLAIGQIEWRRLDWVVEKATELGVAGVVLVACERSRRPGGGAEALERRRDRLERVAQAAVRQSGQPRPPRLGGLVPFDALLDEIRPGEGVLLDPRGARGLPGALDPSRAERTLLVGPEAGFSEGELESAAAAGVEACRLGGTVLRSETAAIVAATLALAAGGGLS